MVKYELKYTICKKGFIMQYRKDEYLISQHPLKALLVFALPMIIGNIFQQIYHMADSIIVGRLVGSQALAAVGASAAFSNVFICVASGAGVGASIIVSRAFGARDYEKMKQSASTSLIFFTVLSIILGLAGFFLSRPMMTLLNTPDDVLDLAVLYLKVYFVGFPFLFLYNLVSAMFNALGKSRIPLYLLIFSSVLNVILDIWMVASLKLGVFGAALATLIAQGIAAMVSFVLYLREMRTYQADSYSRFSAKDLQDSLQLAVPSIIQQSTVSIGMMLVQSVVNGFGSEALAGFSAGARLESLEAVLYVCMSNALSSYTSQNLGADRPERIRKGYHMALLIDAAASVFFFILLVFFPTPLVGLFLPSDGSGEALRTGVSYISFIGMFLMFIGAKMATDGILRGAGKMKIFMIANLVNLSIRVIVAVTLAPRFGIGFVWYAVPAGWAANFIVSYFWGFRKLSFI